MPQGSRGEGTRAAHTALRPAGRAGAGAQTVPLWVLGRLEVRTHRLSVRPWQPQISSLGPPDCVNLFFPMKISESPSLQQNEAIGPFT